MVVQLASGRQRIKRASVTTPYLLNEFILGQGGFQGGDLVVDTLEQLYPSSVHILKQEDLEVGGVEGFERFWGDKGMCTSEAGRLWPGRWVGGRREIEA